MEELCPKCKTAMIPDYENDCTEEGLDYYVWYECPNCKYGNCILQG